MSNCNLSIFALTAEISPGSEFAWAFIKFNLRFLHSENMSIFILYFSFLKELISLQKIFIKLCVSSEGDSSVESCLRTLEVNAFHAFRCDNLSAYSAFFFWKHERSLFCFLILPPCLITTKLLLWDSLSFWVTLN